MVFFLERPLFPLPDGVSFSADSSTIQLLSKRVQQEEWSALDARGAQESAPRNAFSYPTCTQAIEAISSPDFALPHLTRQILWWFIHILSNTFFWTVHAEGSQKYSTYLML